MSRRFWSAAAATVTGVGSAMVATRFVVDQTGPASLALLRYVIGVCCLMNHATPMQVTVFLALSPVTAACPGAWLLAEPRLAAARGRAHLGRRWPRPRTPAQPRGPGHPA